MKNNFGIIIKIIDYKDNDNLVWILCKNNIYILKFASTRKILNHNRYALKIGNEIAFNYITNKLNQQIYKGISLILINENFDVFYSNYYHFLIFDFFSKILTTNLNKISNINNIYFLLKEFLIECQKTTLNRSLFYLYFLLQILILLMYKFVFTKCIVCNSKEKIAGFYFNEGGVICFNCLRKLNLERDNIIYIKMLKELLQINNYNLLNPFLFSNKLFIMYIYKKLDIFFKNTFGFDLLLI